VSLDRGRVPTAQEKNGKPLGQEKGCGIGQRSTLNRRTGHRVPTGGLLAVPRTPKKEGSSLLERVAGFSQVKIRGGAREGKAVTEEKMEPPRLGKKKGSRDV